MNLNNIRLNIDEKIEKNKKRKKQIKNRFFHKKPFFIEIKNQKINGFLPNTRFVSFPDLYWGSYSIITQNDFKHCVLRIPSYIF